jgi:hypothetical protein
MKNWLIQLKGHEFDLQEIVEMFNQPYLNIIEQDGSFYLKSIELNSLLTDDVVYKKAVELLEILNGIAKLNNTSFQNVKLDAIVEIDENGRRKSYKYASAKIKLRSRVSVTATVVKHNGKIDSTEKRIDYKPWIDLAKKDVKASQVLKYLLKGDWYSLYKIYEIIREDLGGESNLLQKGWVTRKMLSRFRHTANSEAVLGEHARHTGYKHKPPKDPMSKPEALNIINTIVKEWLSLKSSLN